MSPNLFFGFPKRELAYGTEEAKQVHSIEKYTEMEILKIVKENNLGDAIDLTSGANLMLFFTDKEGNDARADYEAAKSAGLDVSKVEWLSKAAMQAVSPTAELLLIRSVQ